MGGRLRAVLEHHRDFANPTQRPSTFGSILRLAEDYAAGGDESRSDLEAGDLEDLRNAVSQNLFSLRQVGWRLDVPFAEKPACEGCEHNSASHPGLFDGTAQGVSREVRQEQGTGFNGTDAEGWFDTGDLARIDEQGYVRITGRSKDVIIRGGENIPVVEIESLLYRHPAVAMAAIVAYPDERLGERACAVVVTKPGQSMDLPEIVRYLKENQVATQYIPERLQLLDAMPATPSGKIQKFKLREMLREGTAMQWQAPDDSHKQGHWRMLPQKSPSLAA